MTDKELKTGDMVRVRPEHQTAAHRSTEIGRIVNIAAFSRFPIGVQFKTHLALFTPNELEKV